jgi:para-nitrobenzyl esterase
VQRGHDRISTLLDMSCPAYLMASGVATPAQAWVYRFNRIRPGPGGQALRSYHGAEIPYVFGSHDSWFPDSEEDQSLTRFMLSAWARFATTGHPGAEWPRWQPEQPEVMALGSRIGAMAAPDAALCRQVAQHLYDGRRDRGGK